MKAIGPQPGPQQIACKSEAEIIIYGGAAGGGKSWLMNYLFAIHAYRYPGFGGVIFRRTNPQLTGSGSIWEESGDTYRALGARARNSPPLEWRLGSSIVQYLHLQHEHTVHEHQGKQYAGIGLDEATHFTEKQIWYLMSRNRLPDSMKDIGGFQPFMLMTCNPDPDHCIRQIIDWWIDSEGRPIASRAGVLRWFVREDGKLVWADSPQDLPEELEPRSLTFIPSRLDDNQALLARDPTYRAKLMGLLPHERAMLLEGNWDARPVRGDLFQRAWFRRLGANYFERSYHNHPDLNRELMSVSRCWDLAATPVEGDLVKDVPRPADFKAPSAREKDPDWTVGVKVGILRNGQYVILDAVRCRDTPGAVDELIKRTCAADGPACVVGTPIDPGQAGLDQFERKRKMLALMARVEGMSRTKNKLFYAREAAVHAYNRQVWYLPGEWNSWFFRELESFTPDPKEYEHDDCVDAFADCFRLLKRIAVGYEGVKDGDDHIGATAGFGRDHGLI